MKAADTEFYRGKSRDWYRQRDRVEQLVAGWEQGVGREKLAGIHELVRAEVMTLMREKARRIVARPSAGTGGSGSLRLLDSEFHDAMRAFICRQRLARFGPMERVSDAEWRAQIEALCAEFGVVWVERAGRHSAARSGAGEA